MTAATRSSDLPALEDRVVVTIMGAVAAELQSIGHRPNFFYLQHAMGLASSMGLGIALARPELQVVVFDGDGSMLMNLGGLTTLARYRPRNLVHVVFDNESLLSVGGFPTATSTGSDLAGIAAAAGVPRTATVRTLDDVHARVRRGARRRRSDDDRRQGRRGRPGGVRDRPGAAREPLPVPEVPAAMSDVLARRLVDELLGRPRCGSSTSRSRSGPTRR